MIYMCYSLFAALFSKTFLSHPPFKYPRSAPAYTGGSSKNRLAMYSLKISLLYIF